MPRENTSPSAEMGSGLPTSYAIIKEALVAGMGAI